MSNQSKTYEIRVGGSALTCHVYGRGPLCVVHPGDTGLSWRYARIPLVERELTMAYLDPAGAGSDPADRIGAVVDRLGGEPALVAGHASGGFAAQRYALRHPACVAGLILYSTSPVADDRTEAATHERLRATGKAYAAAFSARQRRPDDATAARTHEILPAYFADYWQREEEFRAVHDLVLPSPGEDRANGTFDVRAQLPSIVAPTLVMSGAHDVFFPAEVAGCLHSGIPRSRIVLFQRSGHLAHLEETERFAHVLVEFARRVTGPGHPARR